MISYQMMHWQLKWVNVPTSYVITKLVARYSVWGEMERAIEIRSLSRLKDYKLQ